MKRRKGGKRKAGRAVTEQASTVFIRGFLVAGLLIAIQNRFQPDRRMLRQSLQGGAALAAGTVAAEAFARRDYARALAAVAVGAAGVVAAEMLLKSDNPITDMENDRGQETEAGL